MSTGGWPSVSEVLAHLLGDGADRGTERRLVVHEIRDRERWLRRPAGEWLETQPREEVS